jgi:uncharacterized protein (TIGR04255 family)
MKSKIKVPISKKIKYINFPNAPIIEAILDIYVKLSGETTIDNLEAFYENVKEDFPEKQQRISHALNVNLSIEGVKSSQSLGGPDGYLFRSVTQNKIVQARMDGFTFNKLKPYENWKMFGTEAHKLWNIYFKIAKPLEITRIALRYINRIEIPLPINDFDEYILTNPKIADTLPQAVESFFMQFVIPNPDISAKAVIIQTMENPINNKLPIIFDINVFREVAFIDNKSKIWEDFEKLRDFKNDIFFNSITKKTKELFK